MLSRDSKGQQAVHLATARGDHPVIEAVLDEYRPRLRLDGAELNVVGFDEAGLLRLRMTGRHASCPMAMALLKACLESALRERVPGLVQVELES